MVRAAAPGHQVLQKQVKPTLPGGWFRGRDRFSGRWLRPLVPGLPAVLKALPNFMATLPMASPALRSVQRSPTCKGLRPCPTSGHRAGSRANPVAAPKCAKVQVSAASKSMLQRKQRHAPVGPAPGHYMSHHRGMRFCSMSHDLGLRHGHYCSMSHHLGMGHGCFCSMSHHLGLRHGRCYSMSHHLGLRHGHCYSMPVELRPQQSTCSAVAAYGNKGPR